MRDLEAEGRAHDTIRLYLLRLKSTSGYICQNYPEEDYVDIARSVKLPKQQSPIETEVLEPEDLQGFARYLMEKDQEIYPIFLLQGLCGLRVREALALREQDLDLAAGKTKIGETPIHHPKTLFSHREIPVPRHVVSTLAGHLSDLLLRHIEGYLFLAERGKPWRDEGYTRRLKRRMVACARAGHAHSASSHLGASERRLRHGQGA